MSRLQTMLSAGTYQTYAYAYPHKTAYRPLDRRYSLTDLWAQENRGALFLYVHIPFCEMRCGFCNLFTQHQPQSEVMAAYLTTLTRQAKAVKACLGNIQFARLAIGGGTPTLLEPADLLCLFELMTDTMGVDLEAIPISVEVSPGTVTPEKLACLRSRHVNRISIGIQSFVEAETAAAGRPQPTATAMQALQQIRDWDFPLLNIDLIYGLSGQTLDTWRYSLETALQFTPEEVYLYPLYVRPLTGLGRAAKSWQDERLSYYRYGRDWLLAQGYQQVSMRMFRSPLAPHLEGPVYCCQDDGMVGLGCGARSYTQSLHYASDYAVGASRIAEILKAYIDSADSAFQSAGYGFVLDANDQRRRYVIQSLLQTEGLDLRGYQHRFQSQVLTDLPELTELLGLGLAEQTETHLILNPAGLEQSDTLGAWLYSQKVQHLMETYAWS
ncbi:MAG: coproporphyrinogen III oxidase family protein [Acaryochloris sp. RU_4_1]|nr:coproporphyrinogen III oxidase family protein [Acaryochloris sp. SU_5_25]NJM66452.1 coproporphyrinogen III oxidase family protein [Acaryochloris sp. RU_4_1]NJR55094.1 coproporphyrinogen III oxidase family protein [Acaryochloris sp. CRU_2_0]